MLSVSVLADFLSVEEESERRLNRQKKFHSVFYNSWLIKK